MVVPELAIVDQCGHNPVIVHVIDYSIIGYVIIKMQYLEIMISHYVIVLPHIDIVITFNIILLYFSCKCHNALNSSTSRCVGMSCAEIKMQYLGII